MGRDWTNFDFLFEFSVQKFLLLFDPRKFTLKTTKKKSQKRVTFSNNFPNSVNHNIDATGSNSWDLTMFLITQKTFLKEIHTDKKEVNQHTRGSLFLVQVGNTFSINFVFIQFNLNCT